MDRFEFFLEVALAERTLGPSLSPCVISTSADKHFDPRFSDSIA